MGDQRKKSEKKNRGDGGGTFRLHFWNLHKIWIQESMAGASSGFQPNQGKKNFFNGLSRFGYFNIRVKVGLQHHRFFFMKTAS